MGAKDVKIVHNGSTVDIQLGSDLGTVDAIVVLMRIQEAIKSKMTGLAVDLVDALRAEENREVSKTTHTGTEAKD